MKRGGLKKVSGIQGCLVTPNRVNSNYMGATPKAGGVESILKKKVRIQEDEGQTPSGQDVRRVIIEEEKKGNEHEWFVIGQNPSSLQLQEGQKEVESDGSSSLYDEDDEEEKAKYKKYYSEQKKKTRGSMVGDAENLVKVKTQKEIYYEDRDKLAASKSYIYLA